MKLGFAATFDPNHVDNWSGTPFHMINALQMQGISLKVFGNLQRRLPPYFKLKQLWKKLRYSERESPRFNIVAAKNYSEQIKKNIQNLALEAIIAPQINPIAFLDTDLPIFLWTDALYASLQTTYPGFKQHSQSSIRQAHTITQECISRCKLLFFSSTWAAASAVEHYNIATGKIRVIPFGANMRIQHGLSDIQLWLKAKAKTPFKILFIGKHWDRKGGDIVYNVVSELYKAGLPIELHVVGCYPPKNIKITSNMVCHGFISKSTTEGLTKISKLLQESHILFVPSRAEAYGIVFCEANAFGLPCVSSDVGGIPTIIKNGINGQLFPVDASIQAYVDYMSLLIQDRHAYENLSVSAFNEYETRLNWCSASASVIEEIESSLG